MQIIIKKQEIFIKLFVFCFTFAKKRDKYSIRVNPNNGLISFFFLQNITRQYTDTHGHINIKNKQWNSEFDLSLMMQNTFERNKILITFEYEQQQQQKKTRET